MRIPAVAIAVALSGGILLGRGLHLSHGVLGISFLSIFVLLIIGIFFAWSDRLWAAAIFSVLGWIGVGALGIVVASRPLAAEHVLRRIATGQIELRTPLRWYGYLRSEPARLAWGIGDGTFWRGNGGGDDSGFGRNAGGIYAEGRRGGAAGGSCGG